MSEPQTKSVPPMTSIQLAQMGIEEIDLQHAKLVGEFERLRFWIARGHELGATIDALGHLNAYVTEHLDYEEEMLRQRNYPQLREHMALHSYFRKELENLSRRLMEGEGDVSELLAFLKQWIIQHIGQADLAYARYLADEPEAGSTEPACPAGPEAVFQIDVAINAHQAWRQRLEWAIDGRLDELPAVTTIRDDTACVLGHWLYGRGRQECNCAEFDTIVDIHREFHAVAGEIARLCHAGEIESARELMMTDYNRLSERIVGLLHGVQEAASIKAPQ